MRLGDKNAVAKPRRTETVRVDVDKQLATPLSRLGQRTNLHDLPGRPDGDIAVCAVVRSRDDLAGKECAHMSKTGHGRTRGKHRTTRVKDNPDLALRGSNRRLVDIAEQPSV